MFITRYIALAILGVVSLSAATPVPCDHVCLLPTHLPRSSCNTKQDHVLTYSQATLDKILLGQLPRESCCSYGKCNGHVNVQGG